MLERETLLLLITECYLISKYVPKYLLKNGRNPEIFEKIFKFLGLKQQIVKHF